MLSLLSGSLTKAITMKRQNTITAEPKINTLFLISASVAPGVMKDIILPDTVPRTTPTPPIILIMAFPSPLISEGVKSGIIATTGERHVDIIKLNTIISSIKIPKI